MFITHKRFISWIIYLMVISTTTVLSQDCAFNVGGDDEVDSCGYIMDTKRFSVGQWQLGSGVGSYYYGGPKEDGGGSITDGFAFTPTDDMVMTSTHHKKTWMLTPVSDPTGPTGRCLRFSYATNGLSLYMLELLLVMYQMDDPHTALQNSTEGEELFYQMETLWSEKLHTTEGQWNEAKVTFASNKAFSLAFAAEPNHHFPHNRGYAAVDNITFTLGPCDYECMFDMDTCSWTGNGISLDRGSSKRNTGPSRDQSTSLNHYVLTGGYAYLDSDYPRRTGDTATLVSPLITATDDETPMCVKFWVNLHGGGIGDVRLLYTPENDANTTEAIWTLFPDSHNKPSHFGTDIWQPCQITVPTKESHTLTIETQVGTPGSSDIAIDTITTINEPCPSYPPGSSSLWGDCTFLDDMCDWEIVSDASYDSSCTMLSRASPHDNIPPGHTVFAYPFTDLYMKFDLGCYRDKPRSTASLASKVFDTSEPLCFSFWVYMFTQVHTQTKFAALRVILISGGKKTVIWSLQNHQLSQWTYAEVTIPAGNSQRIEIEGTKGSNTLGMIGVDDITVFRGECQVKPKVAHVESADCTFDKDYCEYTIASVLGDSGNAEENWAYAAKNEVELDDHTYGAGQGGHAYMDAFKTPMKSRLLSPTLSSNTTYCFTFYFAHMHLGQRKLSVYKDTSGTSEELWNLVPIDNDMNLHWQFAEVPVEEQEIPFSLYIQGEAQDGGWAIDDIQLLPDVENCKKRPDYATTPSK